MTGSDSAGGGVANGVMLMRFASAVLTNDADKLAAARTDIAATMGGAALTDTAGVAALFNAIDRVADATGIPMEAEKTADTVDFRAAIGVDNFAAAAEKGNAPD